MTRLSFLAPLFLAAFVLTGLVPGASVRGAAAAELSADEAWARASMGAGTTGAVFLQIHNVGSAPARIVAAATPAAEAAELHTHQMDGSVMRMRPVEAFEIPAGGSLRLQPGGDHIMLFGLLQPLREGDSFDLTLTSESGESVTLAVQVLSPTHMEGMGHGSGMGHGMEGGQEMPMQPQN
jgi:copper(I)-binding protein